MHTLEFAIVAAAILAYGLFSKVLNRYSLTAPMAFALLGLIMSEAVLGLAHAEMGEGLLHLLAELTLVLVLFADAARVDARTLFSNHFIPFRMLLLGLPLAVGFGALAAIGLFPGFTIWEAALLAAVLAPTDAALGQSVMTDTRIPLRVRQPLNMESGLNDGLAVPVVLFFLAFATHSDELSRGAFDWVVFGGAQVAVGVVVGALVGGLGGRAVDWCARRGLMTGDFRRLAAIGLSLIAFSLAALLGGAGLVAAFLAGLMLGVVARGVCQPLYEFGEAEGQLLTLITFLLFGLVMLPPALEALDWRIAAYAALSLFVVRPLAILVSLFGTRLKYSTRLLLGWFGPRGLASILFALIIAAGADFAARAAIIDVAAVTIALSIVLHGLSSGPAASLYVKILGRREDNPDALEFQDIPDAAPARFGKM